MNNNILLGIFIVAIGSYFFYFFATQLMNILRQVSDLKIKRSSMLKWPRIKGRVVRLGYGLDYIYPSLSLEFEKRRNPDFVSPYPEDIYNHIQDAKENRELFGDVLIEYEYVCGGKEWIGRRISLIKSDSHEKFLYKVKVGDAINIIVNPQDPSDCFLKVFNDEDLERYANSLIISSIKLLVFGLIAYAVSMVAFFGPEKI